MRGYKVFEPDWTCRGFQYKVGEVFEEDVDPKCCERGFHFCTKLNDCFSYYNFDLNNKVAEVEALGDIDTEKNDSKVCTNKIKIIRELTWEEVFSLVNMGKDNKGIGNTGDYNNGNYNTGNENTGYYNSGSINEGNFNSGSFNEGSWNNGNENKGSCNSGDCNTGSYNVGDRNNGSRNTGRGNLGDYNTGNYNKGKYNAGRYNNGNYNIGDCNKTNFSTGCFNTEEEPKIRMFNKPSEWTFNDWINSEAYCLLNKLGTIENKWISVEGMSKEEKKKLFGCKEIDGYYGLIKDNKERNQYWWDALTPAERDEFKELPNFDKKIFAEIMEIDINTI